MSDKEFRSLDAMPEKFKEIYIRALIPILFEEDKKDIPPQKLAEFQKLMLRISLNERLQDKIFRELWEYKIPDIDALLRQIEQLNFLNTEEALSFKYSLVKDMVYIARSDNFVSKYEKEIIDKVGRRFFDKNINKILVSVNQAIEIEQEFLEGKIGISEYEKKIKDTASLISGIGVPIAAIYFAGSVVGLSAAGITSGLAALGLGGILGLSSMVTGIGVVVLMGVATYKGVRWLLGFNEREAERKREELIQQVIKLNQQAIQKLNERYQKIAKDFQEISSKMEESFKEIEDLKRKVKAYKLAFEYLQYKQNKGEE